MTQKILKAEVLLSDGKRGRCDVIEYGGKHWLVPYWLDSPVEKVTRPIRIIQIDPLQHQKVEGQPFQFVVNRPIPIGLYENGQVPPESKYVVVESPDIQFPIPVAKKLH